MSDIEFTVNVEPRETIVDDGPHKAIGILYEIKVRDAHNGNLLVFTNQGYENRQDAVDLAKKLFAGRPAKLNIHDGDGFLDMSLHLAAM